MARPPGPGPSELQSVSSDNRDSQLAEKSSLLVSSSTGTRGGGPVLPELQESSSATSAVASPPAGALGTPVIAIISAAMVELEDGMGPRTALLTYMVTGE